VAYVCGNCGKEEEVEEENAKEISLEKIRMD
jgi:DNA-directed RNA polymerase subunit RPC12/RpoP